MCDSKKVASKAQMTAVLGTHLDRRPNAEKTLPGTQKLTVATADYVPSVSFDWRVKRPDCVSANTVRDQGTCGSCWTYAIVAAVEARMCIANPGMAGLDLSEQELVECVYLRGNDHGDGKGGCGGGLPSKGWDYLAKNGLTSEALRPYRDDDDPEQHFSCGTEARSMFATCPSHQGVSMEERSIMYAIETQGPVSAAMVCPPAFQNYAGGVFSNVGGESGGGHAVTLIGWGTSAKGIPYWVGQNSWASTW
jgi:C1A family cysteine protease